MQRSAEGRQPLAEARTARQVRAHPVDLLHQALQVGLAAQPRAAPGIAPRAGLVAAQAGLQLRYRRCKNGGEFEPGQHRVTAGAPSAGLDQGHERRTGLAGRQLPTGFIAHLRAAAVQHSANAAGQRPVCGHQRNRRAPGGNMVEHAGRTALGLFVEIRTGMHAAVARWRDRAGSFGQRQIHPAVTPQQGQSAGQRVRAHALHRDHAIPFQQPLRRKQHIAGVGAGADPGQCHLRDLQLPGQALRVQPHSQGAAGSARPGLAGVRRLGGCPWRQGAGSFQQHRAKWLGLRRQTGLAQQGAGGQSVQAGVKAQIVAAGGKGGQRFGPAAGGLKPGAESLGSLPGPQLARLPQQLGVGQQHQGAGRVGVAGLNGRVHASEYPAVWVSPQQRSGMVLRQIEPARAGMGGTCIHRHHSHIQAVAKRGANGFLSQSSR